MTRKSLQNHRYLMNGMALGVFVLCAGMWFLLSHTTQPNTIVLRKDGFHPRTLTIEPGQEVRFVNKTKYAFWPASNSHPQHDLYAEFDVGHAVGPGESWSFVFNREGKWSFHDHLHSYYTGVINVGQEAVSYDCSLNLETASVAAKRDCWNTKLLEELEARGAKSAFKMFAGFYVSDPDFAKVGCHLIAHALGDAAYGEYYRKGKDISALEFPPESVYCGYGYYHGILEHMIRDTPDFTKASNFCEWLIREHGSELPRIRLNCYHAIGHGFIPEPNDAEMWGNVKSLTTPAIAACRKIDATDARQECFQGAFNVISDWMWNNQFGFRFPEEDSLSVCRSFDDPEVSRACYYEVSMRLIPFTKDNLVTLYTKYVESIPDDSIADMVMDSAAASVLGAHISDTDFIPYLKQCRAIPERARVGCLKGLTAAFVAHGEPEKEYIKGVAFCGNKELTSSEKKVCYWNTARMYKSVYTPEKVASVCAQFEPAYRYLCADGAEL